jgi:hypothetical protein
VEVDEQISSPDTCRDGVSDLFGRTPIVSARAGASEIFAIVAAAGRNGESGFVDDGDQGDRSMNVFTLRVEPTCEITNRSDALIFVPVHAGYDE